MMGKEQIPYDSYPVDKYFDPKEIKRLARVKEKVDEGKFSDLTLEQKRIEFVRWLIEHGRVSDWPIYKEEKDDTKKWV